MIKFYYAKECHIKKFQQRITLQRLKDYVISNFKKIPKRFHLSYIDQDNDTIVLAGEKDVQLLLQSQSKSIIKLYIEQPNTQFYDQTEQFQLEQDLQDQNNNQCSKEQEKQQIKEDSILEGAISKNSKLVQLTEQKLIGKNDQTNITFDNIMCDECRCFPIASNIYYICSICGDYTLCEQCEKQIDHEHCLLKIKKPQHAKIKIYLLTAEQKDIFDQLSLAKPKTQNDNSLQKVQSKQQQKQVHNEYQTFLTSEEQEKKASQAARYLNQITEISFKRCLNYAKKQIKLTKQQMLQKYVQNPRVI